MTALDSSVQRYHDKRGKKPSAKELKMRGQMVQFPGKPRELGCRMAKIMSNNSRMRGKTVPI